MSASSKRLLIPLFFILSGYPAAGQVKSGTRTDSLMVRAELLMSREEYSQAAECYRAVLETEPDHIPALLGMGWTLLARKDWSRAEDQFDKVLKQDQDNLDANYGKGICQREIGVSRAFLQRRMLWKNAEKHFEFVIDRDSAFKEVLYQRAVLERYRGNYVPAVQLAHRQLEIHPSGPLTQRGIFRLYDYLISNTSLREAETWLKSRKTGYDLYFLGDLYRRGGLFQKADSVFRLFLDSSGFPLQPVMLSLVRLYAETGRSEEAVEIYWQALNRVKNNTEASFILDDLIYIVNGREYRVLKRDMPFDWFKKDVQVFWTNRDPLPSVSVNLRLIEHYRRLVYAEKNYRYDGFRIWAYKGDLLNVLKFPEWYYENELLNDKGLVYLRYGEPDETSFAIADGVEQNHSWRYYQRGNAPQMIFHFSVPDQAPPGYWTLVPVFTDSRILENLVEWDLLYQRLLYGDVMERQSTLQEIRMKSFDTVDLGFRTDRHTWDSETRSLDMYFTTSRFREEGYEDVLQISYAVAMEDFLELKSSQGKEPLETGYIVHDQNMNPVKREMRNFFLDDSAAYIIKDQMLIDEYEIPVTSRIARVTFHARVPGGNKINGLRFTYIMNDSTRDRLSCSSLKLGYEIEPAGDLDLLSRKTLRIVPNPSKKFNGAQTIYVYYEIYNLAFDNDGNTSYTVGITLKRKDGQSTLFDKIAGLFRAKDRYSISLQNEQSGDVRRVAEYKNFDIRQFKSGIYELQLAVADRISGEETSERIDFEWLH